MTNKLTLQIPIVSANMDTVTESEMAIAVAREGGIGIIHRFMSIEEQAQQIARVKKAESFVVDEPIILTTEHTIGDAKKLVDETGTGGILIVENGHKLVGILTTRDLLFEDDNRKKIAEVMQRTVVTAPRDTTLKEAEKLLHAHRIEKLPLVDETGHLATAEKTAPKGLQTLLDAVKDADETIRKNARMALGVAHRGYVMETGGIVLEGRDIGTVVFPRADLKFFVIAGIEARARRRQKDLRQQGVDTNLAEIEGAIRERDARDSSREESPLRKAADAIELDTSDMTIEQQVEFVVEHVRRLQKRYEAL